MFPVKFYLFLLFAKEIRSYPLPQMIIEALGGKIPDEKKASQGMEGMHLDVGKLKTTVEWNTASCTIATEELSDQKQSIEVILSFVEKINEVVPVREIRMRKFSTYWILPAQNYDFSSLERKYRETMLVPNDIANNASDSSAIFDINIGKWLLHHQSGAMLPKQLTSQYIHFQQDNIPKSFLFLETSIIDNSMIKYSSTDTNDFMKKSLNFCISHSKMFENIWGGVL